MDERVHRQWTSRPYAYPQDCREDGERRGGGGAARDTVGFVCTGGVSTYVQRRRHTYIASPRKHDTPLNAPYKESHGHGFRGDLQSYVAD